MASSAQSGRCNWVAAKPICPEQLQLQLGDSIAANHFANNGPCVKRLEARLRDFLQVDPAKAVIAVCNGAAALHALTAAVDHVETKLQPLRYASQVFTFPCVAQGHLAGRVVLVDMDDKLGALDLNLVPVDDVDVIVVTTVLGNVPPLDVYSRWTQKHGKLLLFDHAATPLTFYQNTNCVNHGQGCIVSFHHTKPMGFGEGGVVIVDCKYEHAVRKMINFGYDMIKLDQVWSPTGSNYKLSDVAAAFILCHLEAHLCSITTHHMALLRRWQDLMSSNRRGMRLWPNHGSETVLACVTILLPMPLEDTEELASMLHMSVRKYYKPLDPDAARFPVAHDLYRRVICLPCHMDISLATVDQWYQTLETYMDRLLRG